MASEHHSTGNIVAFVNQLRDQGFVVGLAEVSDAIQMLTNLGLDEREQTKLSLMAILAKTPKEQRIFEHTFDNFFIGEQELSEQQANAMAQAKEKEERIEEARSSLQDHQVTEEFTELFSQITEEQQEWCKRMLDTAKERNSHYSLMNSYLNRVASGWIVAEAGMGLEALPETDLLHKDLSKIDEEEMAQALQLIEMLVMRIRLAADRKHRRAGRRGSPDLRATIHGSLRTGGVPVRPMYRQKPRSSKQVVVLCDVSESMFRYSEFALTLISSLVRNQSKARAFIFSEETEEVDITNLADFESIVKSSDLWRKGTNCGAAFERLLKLRPAVVTSSTLLIVISDARTVDQDLARVSFSEVTRRAREVIWLNPDKNFSSFAQEMAEESTMLGCNTLNDLAEACAQLSLV